MRYIYHYCSLYQADERTTVHIEGILDCPTPVDSMERYKQIKKVISPDNAHRLNIESLSLLRRKLW